MVSLLLLLVSVASVVSSSVVVNAFHVPTKPLKNSRELVTQRLQKPASRIASGSKHILRSRATSLRALATARHQQQGSIEIGVQTAQLLMNPKKHELLKRDMVKKYPFVPASIIDSCINIVAAAFKTIAPDTLKQALQPGGMAKVRPVLKEAVVSAVLQQRVIKYSPILSSNEKANLVATSVDLALDVLLKDSEYLLQRPEVRLEALEEEIRMIQKTEMTTLQIAMYRYRKHPYLWTVAVAAATFYSYAQLAHAGSYKAAFSTVLSGALVAAKFLGRAGQWLYAAALQLASNLSVKINAFLAAR